MHTVILPAALRVHADGIPKVQCPGSTLDDVISHLTRQYPGIGSRIISADNTIRRFVNIYVDDEDVRSLNGMSTPLQEGATIIILSAVAGG
ncbi:MoaD/ThiS family protein [Nocardia cyriacigeorgica]|uniref:MoaD/ThiS family protein n=1 Tax=Nocardia cyriacigeorgica TaxID=135487 RepID=UPI002455A7D3|nr:MoaD/ThiS family protein [Nocardia cyriacigeorgica]